MREKRLRMSAIEVDSARIAMTSDAAIRRATAFAFKRLLCVQFVLLHPSGPLNREIFDLCPILVINLLCYLGVLRC